MKFNHKSNIPSQLDRHQPTGIFRGGQRGCEGALAPELGAELSPRDAAAPVWDLCKSYVLCGDRVLVESLFRAVYLYNVHL